MRIAMFDTVNIHKLRLTNITNIIIKFIANYIKGRQAKINIRVQQGGVLSPIYFKKFTPLTFHSPQKTYKLLMQYDYVDKGKGVVILDIHDYYAKLDCIINDNSKFHEINQDTKVHLMIKNKSLLIIMSTNI